MNRKWTTRISRAMAVAGVALLALFSFSGGDAQQPTGAVTVAYARPSLSGPELSRLREGLSSAQRGDWMGVRQTRALSGDPLVRRILQWRLAAVQNSDATFDEIDNALKELQGWPARDTMRKRAEQMIFDSVYGPADRVTWLKADGGPLTGDGQVALAQAYARLGRASEAQALGADTWRERSLTGRGEAILLGEFGSALTREDHADRVDRLLWRDDRSGAQRLLARLGPGERAVAAARIALQARRTKGLQKTVNAVPSAHRSDPGFLYDRARYVRRAGRPEEALTIAARINPLDAPVAARDALFEERRLYIPRALRMGQPSTALSLCARHGLTSGESFADAEWLAGWISLRFLKNPGEAESHFSQMGANVSTPISKARGMYWRAEALRALGRVPEADALIAQAAQFDFTYYGQLAAAKRDPAAKIALINASRPAPEDVAAFEQKELVRALRAVSALGDREAFEAIAFYLDDQLQSPAEHELLALIALENSYTRTAVRSAKSGIRRGIVAQDAAYPLVTIPAAALAPGQPEPALILAITRQESEFDPQAVSPANARGLMQLIPSTARLTARQQGLDYQPSWLTTDPAYNMTLGSAYLGDMIDRWNGSYILAIASYNAGPGRAAEWIAAYGDPRSGGVDPVDWVELIPITETRNYVQRVIENLQVYRYRLAKAPTPIRINEDLRRGSY